MDERVSYCTFRKWKSIKRNKLRATQFCSVTSVNAANNRYSRLTSAALFPTVAGVLFQRITTNHKLQL